MQKVLTYSPADHEHHAMICRKLQQASELKADKPAGSKHVEATEESVPGTCREVEAHRDEAPQSSTCVEDGELSAHLQLIADIEKAVPEPCEPTIILRRSARLASKVSASTPRSSGRSDDFAKPEQSVRKKRSADDALAGDTISTEIRPVKRASRSRSQRR